MDKNDICVGNISEEHALDGDKSNFEDAVLVRSWEIEGVSLFKIQEIQHLLKPYSETKISFSKLREARLKIEKYYEDKGFLAKVIIPPQDVTEGVVQLEVLEARIGEIRIERDGSSLVDNHKILSVVRGGLAEGEFYKSNALNRGLLLADDLPGVSLTGFLQEGSKPGFVDLSLKTLKEDKATAEFSLDNANARALGSERLVFSGSLISPLRQAEIFSVKSLYSQGSFFRSLSFLFPFGGEGFKLRCNVSRLDYNVISSEFKSLNISGVVDGREIEVSYPIIRTNKSNLNLSLSADNRSYLTKVSDTKVKDSTINSFKTELSGNFFDKIGNGGANSANLSISMGEIDGFGVIPSLKGEYRIYNYGFTRQQALTEKLSIFGSIRGQLTDGLASGTGQEDYLDSAENFSLGGLYGVRAYPSGEATGAQGQLVSMELRYLLNANLMLKPHYDWGKVSKRNQSSGGPKEYEISGSGIGLSWNGPWSTSIDAIFSRRLGKNPNPQLTGSDQDGSLKENRFWLSLSRAF
ncbi:MAG: ShlB/FhaC/HecB family hemolysin secretion/activation protein [Verrucomicrobiota bacterium]|nr:ShlB/FhaC/HecB family hemolysin secretion/activation protein [Verrucomicrobiota bacterium]